MTSPYQPDATSAYTATEQHIRAIQAENKQKAWANR